MDSRGAAISEFAQMTAVTTYARNEQVRVSAGTDPVIGKRLWLCGSPQDAEKVRAKFLGRVDGREVWPNPGQPWCSARRVAAGRGAWAEHAGQLRLLGLTYQSDYLGDSDARRRIFD